MSGLLRYISTRIHLTKDGRQLRSSDVTRRKYSTLLQLSSIGAGQALCVGSLLLVGQIAKDVSGSGVLVSVVIATIAHILAIQCHAELRSHFPRVQTSLYHHVFQSVGEALAFLLAWADVLVGLLYSGAIWRVVSAHIDLMAGRVISNATSSFIDTHPHLVGIPDPVAGLLALVCMLYVSLGGSTGPRLLFSHVTNAAVCAMLVFVFILAAFNLKPELWQTKYVFQVQYVQIVRGAALLLPVLSSQRHLLASCDFMWLGIKPAVLGSLAVSGLVLTLAHLCVACSLTSLSPPHTWTSDAALVAAFEGAGVTWVKYALGPIVCLLLTAYGIELMLSAVSSLLVLCTDDLVPQCNVPQFVCRVRPVVVVLGLPVTLLSLLFAPLLLLQTAACLVLLETLCVCSVTLALRYRPPPHIATICENNNRSQPETTSLMEAPGGQDRYGALPGGRVEPPGEEEEDIDRVVEEYRLQHATRCHHSLVHAKPSPHTFRWARVAVCAFCLSVLAAALLVTHNLRDLQHARPLQVTFLVLCLLASLLTVLVLVIKPTDRILPRTFLLRIPSVPAIPLLAMSTVAWLLSTIDTTAALLAVGWLLSGVLVYLVQILRQRESQYSVGEPCVSPQDSPSRPLATHTEPSPHDSQLLATFVTSQDHIPDNDHDGNTDTEMLVQ